jgi:geranylgeranyl diphosphate synthase, type I
MATELTTPPTRAPELRERFGAALAAFLDQRAPELAAGAPPELLTTVRRFVLTGGKRLRPMFCYWGWRGAGAPDSDRVIEAAAALELFHAFALIHDDIIDGSDLRRGEPSVHRVFARLHARSHWRGDPEAFGRSTALLCGDLCAAWTDQMFHGCGLPPERVRQGYAVLARMRNEVIVGQYLDLVTGAREASLASALTVVRLKAARYTVTRPLQIGAGLAGAGPHLQAAYADFGDPLGDAFQLRDDVLGVFGDPAVTGKSILDDLRDGKPTAMMALARDRADPAQTARLRELFGKPELDPDGAAELRRIIVATGAREQIEQLIQARAETALAALAASPLAPEPREALANLAALAVDRES